MKKWLVWCAAGMVSLCASAIETAGTLLVDLRAEDLSGESGKIQSWQNHGDQSGAFTNVVAGQGPVFRTYGPSNTPAVYFSRENSNSILAGMQPDALITGGGSWTLETWINIPSLEPNGATFFSWTYRAGTSANSRLFEARWTRDNNNAIEHYADNMGWNGGIPAENQWHHIVMTRDGVTKTEYIYVDGVQVQAASKPNINILPDGIFTIGGTQNGARTGWDMLATAYIGQIRVHTGFMPLIDAQKNFVEERTAYGVQNLIAIWEDTVSDAWELPANWVGGCVPESMTRVLIANWGGASLTTPAGLIRSLQVTAGTLTLSENAVLEMWANAAGNQLYVANADDAVAELNVVEGLLGVRDRSYTSQMIVGNNAGSVGTVNIGGGELPARLEVNRDVHIGNAAGATGYVTVFANGTFARTGEENGFIYVGSGSRGEGRVTVEGGTILYPRIQLLNGGLTGIFELNDGFVRLTDSLHFAGGTAHGDAQAVAHLNGGTLQTRYFTVGNASVMNGVYFNGTVVRNTDSRTDYISNSLDLYVQEGGAIFDVIDGTDIHIPRTFLHDPAQATVDGGLTKKGPGVLRLTGSNSSFTGDIHVEDGILLFSTTGALAAGYQGSIHLDNPHVVVGCYQAGSVPWLLQRIPTTAVGYLAVFDENKNDNIDLSSHPGLKLAFRGTVTYTGTITPVDGVLSLSPLNGAMVTYNQAITGNTALLVEGQGNGTLVLGNSNTYSGGTTIRGGKIRLENLAQLGQLAQGNITLENDGALLLNANNFNPTTTLLDSITQTSRGHILLTGSTAGLSFDLSNHPGIYIGTPENALAYNVALTPAIGADYHVGGGWLTYRSQNVTGLSVQNLTDDGATPRGVAVEGEGVVRILNAGSTFTGDIAVTNRGGLFIGGNADLLGGTSNLFVNAGTLRVEGNVTVPARVSVTAGPEGMELNPWGSRYTHFEGTLDGDGRIFTSDGGGVFFGDASNFSGVFDPCRSGSTLGVGVGTAFGWNPSTVITNSGFDIGYFGVQSDNDLAWLTSIVRPLGSDSPYLGLKKRGSGTLTVDVAHSYNGDTLVEQGTLKVGHPLALPTGVGKGRVGVSAGAVLDVNGQNLSINRLFNPGHVTDSVGTAEYIRTGVESSNWEISTTIDPALTLVKAGTGAMTVNSAAIYDLEVEAGTVVMTVPAVGVLGDTALAEATTLQVNGLAGTTGGKEPGLAAYYYRMPDSSQLNVNLMPTIEALETFFNANEPDLVNYSSHAGSTFDFGVTTSTCRFPSPYNESGTENFVAIYRGIFIAQESGYYTFGLQSDDCSVIFVNGESAASINTGSHGWNATVEAGAPVYLNEGENDIAIGFYEVGGGQGLAVWMKTPSATALSLLPQSLLTPPPDVFLASPASRAGGVSGPGTARWYVNAGAVVEVGSAVAANTDVFSGIMTNSPYSTIRKTGLGRQVLASQTLSLGYVDVSKGVLELAVPGNAPAFVAGYKSLGNPDSNFTGVTLASLTGGAPGGELLLTDGSLLKMNRAVKDTAFAGSIVGSAQTAIVKADEQVLTLTGDNDSFAGTWIIHSGVLEIVGDGTTGTGLVINNAGLWVDKDGDHEMTLSGIGTVVKRGEGTLFVRREANATLMQSFIVEGGRVVFDTQGSTLFFTGAMNIGEGCSWGGIGGGKVVVLNTDGLSGSTVTIDGTEWAFQAGSGSSPVQDGLTVALDASSFSTLSVDENNIVTRWTPVAGEIAHTNDNLSLSPYYNPEAFGGRGGVMFGSNLVSNTKTGTRLSSTAQTLVKTVFIVGHVAGGQQGYGGVFGQTAADKGIRFTDPGGSTVLRNSGQDDFLNGGSGSCFINGEGVVLTGNTAGDVGSAPFVLAQYVGSQSSWNSPVNTTIGSYFFNSQPNRYYWGLLGELLVYNRTLSLEERMQVDAYLMGKWLSDSIPTYASPEGMVIELSNAGVLNLGGASSTQTVATVICGEGGGNVINGTLTITDALVITVKPDGTTDPLAFDNVVFEQGAKLIVNGLENAKGAITVFTANSATPVPPFAKANLPKGWSASYRDGVCRLSRSSNVIILK